MPPRCYLGCPSDLAVHLHVFPDPTRFPEQFKKWVEIVGGQLNTPNDYLFFRSKRLCDRHFKEKDYNRNNRLNALAIPTLLLTETVGNKKLSESDVESPLLQTTALIDSLPVDSVGNLLSAQHSKLLSEIDVQIPLLQATALIESLTAEPVGNLPYSEDVSQTTSETSVEVPPWHKSSLIDSLTGHSAAAESGVCFPDTIASSSTTIDLTPGQNSRDTPSNQADVTLGTFKDIHVSLEHNYCKLRVPEEYNKTALDVFTKTPVFSLSRNRNEQRQIRNLKNQIYMLRKRCKTLKSRLASASKICDNSAFQRITKNMTSAAKMFTKMQYSQTYKKPSGRRFSLEEKILSLSLYKRSPKCYSLLAHCFTLPSAKTLKGVLAQIKLKPGINEKIFEKLKKTVREISVHDRLCSIIFDEMSLTPQIHYDIKNDKLKGFVSQETNENENQIANHVLVFMVKGIKANFKQPVAYYFTNSLTKYKLKNIISQVIEKVQATGLIVLCSVCDQSTVNVGAISELVQLSKNNSIRQGKEWRHDYFEINNKKIIPLYDVPHLLKGLRNNILTKDLVYTDPDDRHKEKIIKWKYFQDIYEADKTFGELRLLNKITQEHINPEKIKKMRVKTAAQLFSHSLAVVAEHLTARGILNEDCRNLIPFVTIIDNLFDSLNSNTFHIPNGKIYKGSVKKSSPHHKLWIKAKFLLNSIKFTSTLKTGDKIRLITSTVPTTKNFVKTIEGFEVLWSILSKKYNFDSMMTRHFNQDPVENFFGNIRSYGARNVSPNVVGFEGAFKALLLNNFNSPHSINANCEKDDNFCLQTLDFFLTENQDPINVQDIPEESIQINEEVFMDQEKEKDLGQRNYVCGWVVTKCLKYVVKGCYQCKSKLICKKEAKDSDYIKAKEYNKTKKWLTYPSDEAISFFYEIQSNTIAFLKKNVPKTSIRSKIKWITKTFTSFPSDCEIHQNQLNEYFIETTINILINSWCRHINRILAGKVTYEGDDEMKVAAQMYYNKHRNKKDNK